MDAADGTGFRDSLLNQAPMTCLEIELTSTARSHMSVVLWPWSRPWLTSIYLAVIVRRKLKMCPPVDSTKGCLISFEASRVQAMMQ